MIRFLTDEDFKSAILEGVRSRLPNLDIIRVQDAGLRTLRDEVILEFAASEDRIVLSHDLKTIRTHATSRLLSDKPMSGLFLIRQNFPIGRAVDEIVMIAVCSRDDEWHGAIEYLPL